MNILNIYILPCSAARTAGERFVNLIQNCDLLMGVVLII